MAATPVRLRRQIVIDRGWKAGTDIENRVAMLLDKLGWTPPAITQQHRVGPYRLDFAHVPKMVAIEADGWIHQSPQTAVKDARRDSWLRSQGWIVLRVDDQHGEAALATQVERVTRWLRSDDWHDGRGRA